MKWQHNSKELTEAKAVLLLVHDFPNVIGMLEIARTCGRSGFIVLKDGTHLTFSPGEQQ